MRYILFAIVLNSCSIDQLSHLPLDVNPMDTTELNLMDGRHIRPVQIARFPFHTDTTLILIFDSNCPGVDRNLPEMMSRHPRMEATVVLMNDYRHVPEAIAFLDTIVLKRPVYVLDEGYYGKYMDVRKKLDRLIQELPPGPRNPTDWHTAFLAMQLTRDGQVVWSSTSMSPERWGRAQ